MGSKRVRGLRLTSLILAVTAVCAIAGCSGGSSSGPAGKKITDQPGMLGGETKPDVFAETAPADKVVATALSVGVEPRADSVRQNRVSWYDASLSNDERYVVTLQPQGTDENSDLYVFQPPTGQLQQLRNSRRGHAGNTLATPDWVGFLPERSGRHQFGVAGYSPATADDPNDYRLEVDVALAISVNGESRGGTLTATGSHWYRFGATKGEEYTVALEASAGDCDLFVYGAASHLLRGSSTGGADDQVVFTAQSGGIHYVRVYCAANGPYSLTVSTAGLSNLFFLHHSTGNGFVVEGDMRQEIEDYNSANGTNFIFWDHGYNGDGLRDGKGVFTGTNYDIPNDNTDPDGLHYLWTSPNADAVAARNQILANHEVIAFKSCFPASEIPNQATLNNYKTWYLAMRDFFDARPDRLFVVMSTPPLHRLATTALSAQFARAFANWLKSDTYLAGHPNIVCFDLFDMLAEADTGGPAENRLRYAYEGSHASSNSHPNATANAVVGPALVKFLCEQAEAYVP